MKKKDFNVTKHLLVPKHAKLSDKEKNELFERYNASETELPKILKTDPAIKHLKVEAGDIIKVERKSHTAGEAAFYRVVVNA